MSSWRARDLVDPLLHAVAAAAICVTFVLSSTPWIFMMIANGVFWFGREWAQSKKNPSRWSTHKHIEWLLPTLVGMISSYVAHIA